ECDGTRAFAQGRAPHSTRSGQNDQIVPMHDLVGKALGQLRRLAARDVAERNERWSVQSARRAPWSTTTRPEAPRAKAIQSFRLESRPARGGNEVPTA